MPEKYDGVAVCKTCGHARFYHGGTRGCKRFNYEQVVRATFCGCMVPKEASEQFVSQNEETK